MFLSEKVRVLTTANDVLHAWYVPALAVKQDAIPDLLETHGSKLKRQEFTEVNVPNYAKQHAYMPIVVEVVTEDQFNQWVLDNQTTKTTQLNINE